MPVSIGSTRCTGAGPAPFFACVRCALAVLFVIGGSLAPVVGTVCLGRRDSHADQGAVATQFSNSTGTGTSSWVVRVIASNDGGIVGPSAFAAARSGGALLAALAVGEGVLHGVVELGGAHGLEEHGLDPELTAALPVFRLQPPARDEDHPHVRGGR